MSKVGALVAGVFSLCVIAVSVYLWFSLGDVAVTTGGYLALVGGGLATLALGGGLMGLVFYSNRTGFDERAGASPVQDKKSFLE